MKNRKLNLQKTTITKLSNLQSIRGGSCGGGGGTGNDDNNSPDQEPTVTKIPDLPDLSTVIPS